MRLDPQLRLVVERLKTGQVRVYEDEDVEDHVPGIGRAEELGLARTRHDGGFGAYTIIELTAKGRGAAGVTTPLDRLLASVRNLLGM